MVIEGSGRRVTHHCLPQPPEAHGTQEASYGIWWTPWGHANTMGKGLIRSKTRNRGWEEYHSPCFMQCIPFTNNASVVLLWMP